MNTVPALWAGGYSHLVVSKKEVMTQSWVIAEEEDEELMMYAPPSSSNFADFVSFGSARSSPPVRKKKRRGGRGRTTSRSSEVEGDKKQRGKEESVGNDGKHKEKENKEEMWSQIEQEMAIVAQIEEEEAEMRRMYGDSFQVQSGEIEMRWKVEIFDEERFCKLSLALLK